MCSVIYYITDKVKSQNNTKLGTHRTAITEVNNIRERV